MPTPAPTNGICETSRQLPFAASDVFNAFAQPELLAQWWGPEGFTNTFELFEFKPQGRWQFVMHGPDGKDYPNESVFLETAPNKVVVQHTCAPHFTLTVALIDLGAQTELRWRQVFEDPAFAVAYWHVLEPANQQNLDRLHRCLTASAAPPALRP